MNIFTHAKPTDWELLRDLNYKIYVQNPSFDENIIEDFVFSEQGKIFFDEAISKPGGCCLILWVDGKPVGYTNGEPDLVTLYRSGKVFEVDNLGVIPEVKGKGYGQILLDEITKWAKDQGFERIYLRCFAKNANALNFYRKNGFADLDIGLEKSI